MRLRVNMSPKTRSIVEIRGTFINKTIYELKRVINIASSCVYYFILSSAVPRVVMFIFFLILIPREYVN